MSEKYDADESEETERTATVNRRSFVKAIGAAGVTAGFGTLSAGNAFAKEHSLPDPVQDRLTHLRQKYDTASKARSAFEKHSNDLFKDLSGYQLIGSSSVKALPTDELQTKQEYISSRQGMVANAFVKEGTPTAHVFTTTNLPEGRLVVVVQPQRNTTYATLYPDSEFWAASQPRIDRGGLTTKMEKNIDNKPLFIEPSSNITVVASSSLYCNANDPCYYAPGEATCCTSYEIVCVCGGGCAINDNTACCSNPEPCPCGGEC